MTFQLIWVCIYIYNKICLGVENIKNINLTLLKIKVKIRNSNIKKPNKILKIKEENWKKKEINGKNNNFPFYFKTLIKPFLVDCL